MEIPRDYYLNSLSELEIEAEMYRTEGSEQIQVWQDWNSPRPGNGFIEHTRYFAGKYKDKRFFAKQLFRPSLPNWSIRRDIEYQLENLLLFKDLDYVPDVIFFTDDIVGMEYIEGKTIKSLYLADRINSEIVDHIIAQLLKKGPEVTNRLKKIGRYYDCNYNNILVTEDYDIKFIDFDFARGQYTLSYLIRIMQDLKVGKAMFAENGTFLYKSNSFMDRTKRYARKLLNR